MPIRAELRHFYRGPKWSRSRELILTRANNRCEHCGVPNHLKALRVARWWWDASACLWRDGERTRSDNSAEVYGSGEERHVRIVLTIAHLNGVAGDDRDDNLAALCQWCHLTYDKRQHKETRSIRKDAARPLLAEVIRGW